MIKPFPAKTVSAAIIALALLLSPHGTAAAEGGEGETCGGIVGSPCKDGLWCDPNAGYCGGADISGVCVTAGAACPKDFRPVCGCDDHTYPNDCERQKMKVAKMSDGTCDPEKCPEIADPVCATKDGKRVNYSNECRAKRSGATTITKGPCKE